jgi:putative toxin-antitoxin system antitoxin component (TIGR02293 family)
VQQVNLARRGVTPLLFNGVAEAYNLSNKELAELLDISTRSIERYLKAGKTIRGLVAQRLITLSELYMNGLNTFGTSAKFLKWLNASIPALGNQTPKSFLDTQHGINLLVQELGRIRHGIFA